MDDLNWLLNEFKFDKEDRVLFTPKYSVDESPVHATVINRWITRHKVVKYEISFLSNGVEYKLTCIEKALKKDV